MILTDVFVTETFKELRPSMKFTLASAQLTNTFYPAVSLAMLSECRPLLRRRYEQRTGALNHLKACYPSSILVRHEIDSNASSAALCVLHTTSGRTHEDC